MPCALAIRSEEHTSELQSPCNLVCRLLLEKKTVRPAEVGARENGRALLAAKFGRPLCFLVALFEAFEDEQEGQLLDGVYVFFNDTATTEIYTLSLHDALPIYLHRSVCQRGVAVACRRADPLE